MISSYTTRPASVCLRKQLTRLVSIAIGFMVGNHLPTVTVEIVDQPRHISTHPSLRAKQATLSLGTCKLNERMT